MGIPDAVSTLFSRTGDCNEHAALFAALSRSLSIPTRIIAGVKYHEGMFYYHAWNEVCLAGKWISLDATKNQFPADLSHIKFVQGETNEQIKIGALLGKLKIEVLKMAKKISSKSNLTIKIGKQAFYKQLEMPLREAYNFTSKMMTLNMMSYDAKEGISAFFEKRKPNWKNK